MERDDQNQIGEKKNFGQEKVQLQTNPTPHQPQQQEGQFQQTVSQLPARNGTRMYPQHNPYQQSNRPPQQRPQRYSQQHHQSHQSPHQQLPQQQHRPPQQKRDPNPKQAWAAAKLGVEAGDLTFFDEMDPLNPSNKVSGYICKKTDKLLLMSVNQPIDPIIILPTPSLTSAFDDETFVPLASEKTASYFLAHKWNGINVTVYKYQDQSGNVFVSARPRSAPFLRDTDYGKLGVLSIFVDCLGALDPPCMLPLQMETLPAIFFPLNFDVQSITCELFGARMSHLVKYPFDVKLKALFYTHNEGAICPISEVTEDMGASIFPSDTELVVSKCLANAVEAGIGMYCGPTAMVLEELERVCRLLISKAYELNVTHRRNNGFVENGYWFDHFLLEGWVLYLMDENGEVVDRTMYSVKPVDIRQNHWEKYDAGGQLRTLVALRELHMKGKNAISPQDLKIELGLSNSQWARWGKDVMELVDGVPPPLQIAKMPKNALRMILLVGIPGSGKSTFSKQLVGSGWERCNQDELGYRKKVEQTVAQHLKEGRNVVVDRCNFDIAQRHVWVKLANSFGVKWITCIILRVDPEVCKQRVSVRQGHETIPSGDQGSAIIDKFKDLWVEPHLAEGFCEIQELRTDQDIECAIQKLTIQHLENKVEQLQDTVAHLKHKIALLEANSPAPASRWGAPPRSPSHEQALQQAQWEAEALAQVQAEAATEALVQAQVQAQVHAFQVQGTPEKMDEGNL